MITLQLKAFTKLCMGKGIGAEGRRGVSLFWQLGIISLLLSQEIAECYLNYTYVYLEIVFLYYLYFLVLRSCRK